MQTRPVVHFNLFEMDGDTRPFEPKRVTGTFKVGGKEVALTMPVVEQIGKQTTIDAYRAALVEIRDALNDMIQNPHGIRA